MTHAAHVAKAMEEKEDRMHGEQTPSAATASTATASTTERARQKLPRDIGFKMPPLHKKPVNSPPLSPEEAGALFGELRKKISENH